MGAITLSENLLNVMSPLLFEQAFTQIENALRDCAELQINNFRQAIAQLNQQVAAGQALNLEDPLAQSLLA